MSDGKTVTLVTRGSALALCQAALVRERLLAADPARPVETRVIRTSGDRLLDTALYPVGEKGLFSHELDQAVLGGEADLAVHSLKDLPTTLPDGLVIAAVTERDDPRDVLVLREGEGETLAGLPPATRVGTSSLRRRAQLLRLRPDLEVTEIRGNVDSRLRKLDSGECDALILAAAGLWRLGLEVRITDYLEDGWLPAAGQGALAVVAREDDTDVLAELVGLDHPPSRLAVRAERALLARLEGGCQVPVGVLARAREDGLELDALVADVDGKELIRDTRAGSLADPERVGRELAERLLERGADRILARLRRESAPVVEGTS
ncbi:MAG: hydroxymethylbilane synthase [Longimicrobiaceae bacterium]